MTADHQASTQTDFVIERKYPATPDAVFAAWADPEAKRLWSDCHPESTTHYALDFRLHGHETHQVRHADGRLQDIEKVFFGIQAGRRIVFSYDIRLDGRALSVSLATVEFFADRGGTRMVYTEQISYLDGHQDRAQRLQGTEEGLDRLGLHLAQPGRLS